MQKILYARYGGPEVMRLETVEPARPGPGQVLVRVKAAAINPIDWKLRQGELKFVTGKAFPRGMGSDFAGVVEAVGPGVTRFEPGDEVLGMTTLKASGAFATAVIAEARFLARKPPAVPFEAAAAIVTVGVTAWNGLFDKADLRKGRRVFVNGCMGGVGQAVTLLALHAGAQVSGSCRAEMKEAALSMGVDRAYDYRLLDPAALRDGYDVVFDTSGAMSFGDGSTMLRKGGVFVDIHPSPTKMIHSLFDKRLKVAVCSPRTDILEGLARAAGEGQLRLAVGKTGTLQQAIELITDLEQGHGGPSEKAVILMA